MGEIGERFEIEKGANESGDIMGFDGGQLHMIPSQQARMRGEIGGRKCVIEGGNDISDQTMIGSDLRGVIECFERGKSGVEWRRFQFWWKFNFFGHDQSAYVSVESAYEKRIGKVSKRGISKNLPMCKV